jgi:hypothetical protein
MRLTDLIEIVQSCYQNDEIHNCHIIIPQTYVHIRSTTHNKVLINVSTLLLCL